MKISRAECVKIGVLHGIKEDRDNLYTAERSKTNWIGHIMCRSCFLKHVIEGKMQWIIEEMGRRGRMRKQLLDEVKEMGGHWNLNTMQRSKTNWIGHIMRRNCFVKRVIEGKMQWIIEEMGRRGRRWNSYWMKLKKREDTEIWKTKHQKAFDEELDLEKSIALS